MRRNKSKDVSLPGLDSKRSLSKKSRISAQEIMSTFIKSNPLIQTAKLIIANFIVKERTWSKESVRQVQKIRIKEEEKSRMLNTFIPRPSYSKWKHEIKEKFVGLQTRSEDKSDESSEGEFHF